MKEIFPGIFRDGKRLYTINLNPGTRVYGEKLIKKGNEYREWDPTRSKLAAAILKGLKENPLGKEKKILYLGAATGTTISHISDIIKEGIVYGVEFSERVFHSLLDLSKKRKNIVPILADARKPEEYFWIEECDLVYCDIADPQETEIAIRNADEFLKKDGYLMIAIKSQSIDVVKKPNQIYKEEAEKLKKSGFAILQLVDLEPFEEKHAFMVAKITSQ